VIRAAEDAGVLVPRLVGWLGEVAGRDAFVCERICAEGLGRRIVHNERFGLAREVLPAQMAAALAEIHKIPQHALPEIPKLAAPAGPRILNQLRSKLKEANEPHPVLSLALLRLEQTVHLSGAHEAHEIVLVHGDFRVGNLLVNETGLVAVIDWEFAHWGHAAEDLAWPSVRAWRFGRDDHRLGGVGSVDEYLRHYNRLTGRNVTAEQLAWWELAGNVRWAISCLTQSRRHLSGQERSVELAVLGRLACEPEREILHLLKTNTSYARPA